MFIKAGNKRNFYKTDDEIKLYLEECKKSIQDARTLVELNRVADEYVYWCEIVKEDTECLVEQYSIQLRKILMEFIHNGQDEVLGYDIDTFNVSTITIKEKYNIEKEKIKKKLIETYVKYLQKETTDEKAYAFSYKLCEKYKTSHYKSIIDEQIELLYQRSSFPIDNMNENKYHVCYNIMYLLYNHDQDKFLKYCDELVCQCDGMANYRIRCIIEGIVK